MSLTISVITPSFNQGRFIERTIKSVLQQDVPLEYVVYDNCSTDGTLDVLRRYEGCLHWHSAPDEGQSDAVNKGIVSTTGDIIAWINSDDLYYPGVFNRILDIFSRHPEVDLLYGDACHIAEDDRVLEPYPTEPWDYERLKEVCFLCQPAVFFRRRVVERFGPLDKTLSYCMDYEYWLRIGNQATVKYLPEVLAGSRLYEENKTLGARVAVHEEICSMFLRNFGIIPSRWVYNYAHAVADEKGYDRQDSWQNLLYCCSLVEIASKGFRRWHKKIRPAEMKTMLSWLGGSLQNLWP